MILFSCPRCGAHIINDYFDTGGQHWHCPNCERNDRSFTLYVNSTSGVIEEIPYEKENKE